MLIKDGANKISALDYPNFWHQGNLKLRLSYQFEPGTDADGVTVHIPLPILNQVEDQGFEWQIPGIRRELVIALIVAAEAGAPQLRAGTELRRGVPCRVTALELPLLDALERELRRMTGVTVSRDDWQWDQVPDHLKMTFRVVGEKTRRCAKAKTWPRCACS